MDYKETTISEYNRHVDERQEHFRMVSNKYKDADYETFLSALQGKDVLDLGCGPGHDMVYFEGKGLNVTGVDLSEAMLLLAKEKGLSVELMDVEEITFPRESFDGIWAAAILLHVPKEKMSGVLRKLHDTLKPHGVLFVSMKLGTGERMVTEDGLNRFFSYWTEEEFIHATQPYFSVVKKYEQAGSADQRWLKICLRRK